MSVRLRLALVFGLLSAVFAVAASFVVYSSAVTSLYAEVDRSLLAAADRFASQLANGGPLRSPLGVTVEVLDSSGRVLSDDEVLDLAESLAPESVSADDLAAQREQLQKEQQALDARKRRLDERQSRLDARSEAQRQQSLNSPPARPVPPTRPGPGRGSSAAPAAYLAATPAADSPAPSAPALPLEGFAVSTTSSEGQVYWVLTVGLPSGGSLRVSRDVRYIEDALASMRLRSGLVALLAVVLAGLAAWVLAGVLTRRLSRLTAAAATVAASADPSFQVVDDSDDELGQLASAFNEMLSSLAAAQEAQRRLMQDAAHELRTPLTSLKTNAQLLDQFALLSPSDRKLLVQEMQSQVDELVDLVNSAVLFSSAPLSLEEVWLGQVVRDAARSFEASGLVVRVVNDAQVAADVRLLRRALSNLLGNVLKYAPGSPATVEIMSLPDGALVQVSDDGPGFPPGSSDLVFDRFYRADAHRQLPGSGLGLSIVHEVAVRHGGWARAGVASSGGALVQLFLPAVPVA